MINVRKIDQVQLERAVGGQDWSHDHMRLFYYVGTLFFKFEAEQRLLQHPSDRFLFCSGPCPSTFDFIVTCVKTSLL